MIKYSKPSLHSISMTNVDARCAIGSSATSENTCTNGPNVNFLSCTIGWANIYFCNVGNAAGDSCYGGSSYGKDCFSGGNDSS